MKHYDAESDTSFEAAASTKKQEMVVKYEEEEVLFKKIRNEQEFIEAIQNSEKEEIKELYLFVHSDELGIAFRYTGADDDNRTLTSDELDEQVWQELATKFDRDAQVYLYGCLMGKGFAQDLANMLKVNTYGSTLPMKFFKKQEKVRNKWWFDTWKDINAGKNCNEETRWVQYNGRNGYAGEHVEMFPYTGKSVWTKQRPDEFKEFKPQVFKDPIPPELNPSKNMA